LFVLWPRDLYHFHFLLPSLYIHLSHDIVNIELPLEFVFVWLFTKSAVPGDTVLVEKLSLRVVFRCGLGFLKYGL
jgi:hypothetical protein